MWFSHFAWTSGKTEWTRQLMAKLMADKCVQIQPLCRYINKFIHFFLCRLIIGRHDESVYAYELAWQPMCEKHGQIVFDFDLINNVMERCNKLSIARVIQPPAPASNVCRSYFCTPCYNCLRTIVLSKKVNCNGSMRLHTVELPSHNKSLSESFSFTATVRIK